MMVQIQNKDI